MKPRPCSFCRKWFLPDVRVKERQQACSARECQVARRKETQATWRAANAGYAIAYRIAERASATEGPSAPTARPPTGAPPRAPPSAPTRPRVPPPLDRLPWDLAKDEFGTQGADFLAVFGRVLIGAPKDQSRSQGAGMT